MHCLLAKVAADVPLKKFSMTADRQLSGKNGAPKLPFPSSSPSLAR